MSIKEMPSHQKNLVGWIGIAIALITGWVNLNNKLQENSLRVDRVEIQVQKLEKDNQNVSNQINLLRIDVLNGFNELKLQLKDKADRERK